MKNLFEKADFFPKSAQLSACSDPELSFCACVCCANRVYNQPFYFVDTTRTGSFHFVTLILPQSCFSEQVKASLPILMGTLGASLGLVVNPS